MNLELKAKHFYNASYEDTSCCGIANAAKDFFNTQDVNCGIDQICVDSTWYKFDLYGGLMFDRDKSTAYKETDPETLIRNIELIPCKPSKLIQII